MSCNKVFKRKGCKILNKNKRVKFSKKKKIIIIVSSCLAVIVIVALEYAMSEMQILNAPSANELF